MNIFSKNLISKNTADLIFMLYKQNVRKIKSQNPRENLNVSKYQNVLIFSPHMDDEIIGTGGFLLEYSKKLTSDKKLTICYLIDNDGEKYTERIHESEKICCHFQAERICLGFKDSFLDFNTVHEQITNLLSKLKPDLVLFADFAIGNAHPDHNMLAKIIHSIISNFPEINFLGYEVLCPIESNCIIENIPKTKLKLLKNYKSQLKKINYIKFLKKKYILEGTFNEHYFLYGNNSCKL